MTTPTVPTYPLTSDTHIKRIVNGMWQVSGAHGKIDPERAIQAMMDYHEDGFTTWDLADHYGPAEQFIGRFRTLLRAKHGEDALGDSLAFTKWVPRPEAMPMQKVEAAIDISRQRMQMNTLDMLQFHWWDYSNPAYIDALKHMEDLKLNGKIKHLALTNFDTEHTAKILDAGVEIVSNQVQYSIIDRRPQIYMTDYYQKHGMSLLTYGTLAGGLLTDRYLDAPEPMTYQLKTVSLRKYKNMIDIWGGWSLFQRLLHSLRQIADKHEVSIANVAVGYVLQQPVVAGVIAGARLGISENRTDNKIAFTFELDESDFEAIDAVSAQARNLIEAIGDCGDEYRR